jgi:hypothetical protein
MKQHSTGKHTSAFQGLVMQHSMAYGLQKRCDVFTEVLQYIIRICTVVDTDSTNVSCPADPQAAVQVGLPDALTRHALILAEQLDREDNNCFSGRPNVCGMHDCLTKLQEVALLISNKPQEQNVSGVMASFASMKAAITALKAD